MAVSAVSHEPPGYECPFCAIAGGAEPEFTAWREEQVFVQIAKHWDPGGPGWALVIPTTHYENIYALPDDVAARIARTVRLVAIAMRSGYPCDGVTVRQNNEPAGGQDVWHLLRMWFRGITTVSIRFTSGRTMPSVRATRFSCDGAWKQSSRRPARRARSSCRG